MNQNQPDKPVTTSESTSESEFLSAYDASKYERPSVTADIVVFTMDEDDRLSLLLIRRGGHPYKGHWALPGGFLNAGKESLEEAAARELFEETGIKDAYLKQLCTFSNPGRDPRTHVISVAYTALIPKEKLSFKAGDDACDAKLFSVYYDDEHDRITLGYGAVSKITNVRPCITETQLAFDHADIIKTAIRRLRGRIDYEPDAFELLKDKSAFTIYELQHIFDSIKNTKLDSANFRKMFARNYVNRGIAAPIGNTRQDKGRKAAALYKLL